MSSNAASLRLFVSARNLSLRGDEPPQGDMSLCISSPMTHALCQEWVEFLCEHGVRRKEMKRCGQVPLFHSDHPSAFPYRLVRSAHDKLNIICRGSRYIIQCTKFLCGHYHFLSYVTRELVPTDVRYSYRNKGLLKSYCKLNYRTQ